MNRLLKVLAVLLGALLLLAIPGPSPDVAPAPARGIGFAWNQDTLWRRLETEFVAARGAGCPSVGGQVGDELAALDRLAGELTLAPISPDDTRFDQLESRLFALTPLVAACPDQLAGFVALQGAVRNAVKDASRSWDLTGERARLRLYRALYGSRAAVEEVLQHHPRVAPALFSGREEPSAAPATTVAGVRIHSGDLLVSRGGYPTSALIARGNDFPGNFSHVALVHVDSATGRASTVEAHIERGVAISTAEDYLADKKLRIMVLRLRQDHPAVRADPLLAHRAATWALERAQRERIPYDFTMDYRDDTAWFCSEVASSAYRRQGVTLWTGLSTISAPGLRRWLASFGVRHFETQEPSDLEYDPQLVVVAEWRDPASLHADRVDNAVIDAMLEGAERGDALGYPWYQLPLVRILKGWSVVRNLGGGIGPVPEGMSARAALRNRAFAARQRQIVAEVNRRVAVLERDQGYPLTYWTLVDLARAALTP